MTIAKDFANKAGIAFVALAMIFSLVAPGAFAQAQTAEELQTMINQLMQQIAALQAGSTTTGSTTSTGFVWTRDLKTGTTGADVKELQKFLNSDPDTRVSATGAGSAGMETEYFGPATAAAVSKFQVKYRSEILSPSGLVNPTGFFGPSTRAKANALNTVVVVPPADTGTSTGTSTDGEDDDNKGSTTLKGGEADVKSLNIFAEDDASADARGQEVATFELDLARNSGDVRVTRVDVHAKATPAGSNTEDRLFRILEAISITQDGKELGTAKTSSRNDWSNSSAIVSGGQYARVSGLDGIARGDAKTSFSILVDTSRLSDSDLDILVDLGIEVRYEDSTGYFETEKSDVVSFSVEKENTADLRVRTNKNNPESFTIKGETDESVVSDDVLVFDIESRKADFTVETVKAQIVVSSSSVDKVVRKASLYQGSTRIDSQSITSTSTPTTTVTFDLREYELRSDRSESFSIRLDLNKIDGVNVTDGTLVSASVIGVSGYDENDADKTSTSVVTGKDHTYSTSAANISSYKWEVPNSGNFIDLFFTVRADDGDFDVKTADIVASTTGTATTSTGVLTRSTGDAIDNGGGNFKVEEGRTATFRLRFSVTGANGTWAEATVTSVSGQAVPNNNQKSPTATRNIAS